MRRHSGEESTRGSSAKTRFGQAASGAKSRHAELGEQEGMTGHAERRQNVVAEARPGGGKRLEERSPGFAIAAQVGCGARDRTFQDYGSAVLEGVGQRSGGLDPFQALLRQG